MDEKERQDSDLLLRKSDNPEKCGRLRLSISPREIARLSRMTVSELQIEIGQAVYAAFVFPHKPRLGTNSLKSPVSDIFI